MPSPETIKPFVKGDTRTLLDTQTANEVIDLVNKLQSLQVQTAENGTSRLDISGEKAVLIITRSDLANILGSAALMNITVSTATPTASDGNEGDLWFTVSG